MRLEEGASPGRLGDYELVHELKSGGMGKIFLARKRGTGGFEKLAAIKTILKELSDRQELRTMFLDEARLLARLEHPAVAQVHDFGEHEQTLYLAMEYVPGVPFTDLKRDGTPPGIVMRLIAQVCRALHAAHELRDLEGAPLEVVHRDVSPDNLMLTFDGHVKVLDFGIALMRGRHLPATEYGMIKGKPPYLSPEQVKGKRVDRRSDVWSTGVVLWELLTGRNLFVGDSLFAIALAVDEQDIPLPSSLAGQLPDGLDDVVMRALARDPDSRYQSAQEMADALEQIAMSIAAPSIADYTGAALAERSENHRDWLRTVLGGSAAKAPAGRATGLKTVPADAIADLAESQAQQAPHALGPEATADAAEPEASSPTRKALPLVMLALVAAGAGIAWFATSSSSSSNPRAATAPTPDAGVPPARDAAATAVISVDATTGSPDAASTVVATAELDAGARSSVQRGLRRRRPVVEKPEKPEPGPEPEEKGVGTLTIAAEPYALVRLNGKEIGATPQLRKSYPAGTYVIELIHPDTGALRLRKTVKLVDGAHKSVIDR